MTKLTLLVIVMNKKGKKRLEGLNNGEFKLFLENPIFSFLKLCIRNAFLYLSKKLLIFF